MPRKQELTAAKYTAGIERLTGPVLVEYGNKIVSMQMAVAILESRASRTLDRNVITQKCRRGEIAPMGIYHNQLYFYREQVEGLDVQARPLALASV